MSSEKNINYLKSEIARLETELAARRGELARLETAQVNPVTENSKVINNHSSPEEKIRLFMSLFSGRADVYARRFESLKTGKSGYQPVCAHEWVKGVCRKPQVKCGDCEHRKFIPFNENVVRNHLLGEEVISSGSRPFVAGVYPLLADETCRFIAIDFDKAEWVSDASAFLETCRMEGVSAALERSRSGNGGHVWIFFREPVSASLARTFGAVLLTKTLDLRPEIGLDSFDRFFPCQDTMPRGGLGNLIALPLQKKAREKNHTLFLDTALQPYQDQWKYLASINKVGIDVVCQMVSAARLHKEVFPVADDSELDEDAAEPWKVQTSVTWPVITSKLPDKIDVTLANQIFIDSTSLPAILRNRILRLASFSNPEFYQAQAMRLPTWGKPRILYCYEQFPRHIAIPIGCFQGLTALFEHYQIVPVINEQRFSGNSIDVAFHGGLYPEQEAAFRALCVGDNGILSATTAFGKTVVALRLIAERKVNTLILVHRKQLCDQWVERIAQFLGIPKKSVGCIGGGKKRRTGIVDVAVIQSVSRKGVVEEWVKEYGQVIVDECHHISAFSFEQVLRMSPARFKVGLSATLIRKDGQHPIVLMNLGPVRYRVDARKQAQERAFAHMIKIRETAFTFDMNGAAPVAIHDVFQKVWTDVIRNEMIITDVCDAVLQKRKTLLLSERTEHLDVLKNMLIDKVEHIYLLRGGMGKKQTTEILKAIFERPSDEPFVLLATGRYLGEGFDLPELDTLFLTFPVSWKGTIAQYAGRLHREYAGKTEVIIYDYADLQVPVLSRMHEKRIKGYRALGYSV